MRRIALEAGNWAIDAAEHRFGEHLGRPALHLNGGIALAEGVELLDGANELVLAVSETFGGWGVQARFGDLDGIRLVA